MRLRSTNRSELFISAREAIVDTLRDRDFLPEDKELIGPEIAEAAIAVTCAYEGHSAPEAIKQAGILLAKLRIALTPESPRHESAHRLLAKSRKKMRPDSCDLILLGYEIRTFVDSKRGRTADGGYLRGLIFYLKYGADNNGAEPSAKDVFSHLGRRYSTEKAGAMDTDFPKTYRRWRQKWRAYDRALSLEGMTDV